MFDDGDPTSVRLTLEVTLDVLAVARGDVVFLRKLSTKSAKLGLEREGNLLLGGGAG